MESNTNFKEFKKFIESDKSIKSTHKPLNVNSDKDNLSLDDLVIKTKEIISLNFHSTVNGKYLPFHKKSPLMNKGFPQFHPSKIAQMAW